MWTRNGVRYRKVKSRVSRFSKGKVHVERWLKEAKLWWPVCMSDDDHRHAGIGMGWEVVYDTDGVDCQKCLNKIETWSRNRLRSSAR